MRAGAGGGFQRKHAGSCHDLGAIGKSKKGVNSGFDWVPAENGFEQIPLDVAEVVAVFGVPQNVLLSYIKTCAKIEDSLKTLPLALLLVLFFLLMHLYHDNSPVAQGLQKALQHNIEENAVFGFDVPGGGMGHKNINDVHFAADFWSWMRLGVAPLLFPSKWATSEASGLDLGSLSDVQRQYHMFFNLKIGALRLRQEASTYSPCINAELEPVYGLRCKTSDSYGLEMNLNPLEFDVARSQFLENTELTQWFRYQGNESDLDSVQARMTELEKEQWFGNNTARIEINCLFYNGNKDLLSLFTLHVLIARTGHFWKEITHVSLFMNNYSNPWCYVFDTLLYGYITAIFLAELYEVMHRIKENHHVGFKRCLLDYIGIWNAIDWVSIIFGYLMLSIWIQLNFMTQSLSNDVERLQEHEAACHGSSSCNDRNVASVYEDFESIANLFVIYRMCSAFYPFVLIMRLFQAFSAQPRLALVTRTLAGAADDLVHFGIVCLAVFLTYCIMGCVLFGRQTDEFATMDRSLMTCFRALLGDFEFDDMVAIGRPMASIYLSSFLMLMLFIMLNMFIAIIMDVYECEKKKSLSSQTLVTQSIELLFATYDRYVGGKKKVSFDDILDAYSNQDGKDAALIEQRIQVNHFMETVPGLGNEQAEELLRKSAETWRKENGDELALNHIMDFMGMMDAKTEKAENSIHTICSTSLPKRAPNAYNAWNRNQPSLLHQSEPDELPPSLALSFRKGEVDQQSLLESAPLLTLLSLAERRVDEDLRQGMKVGALRGSLINAGKLLRERETCL